MAVPMCSAEGRKLMFERFLAMSDSREKEPELTISLKQLCTNFEKPHKVVDFAQIPNSHILFEELLTDVLADKNCEHIFGVYERTVLSNFIGLSEGAKKMFIYLWKWRNIWVRVRLLPEENSLQYLNELQNNGLIRADPSKEQIMLLMDMLSTCELRGICGAADLPFTEPRIELMKMLMEKERINYIMQIYCEIIPLRERICHIMGSIIKLVERHVRIFIAAMVWYSLPLSRQTCMDGGVHLLRLMYLMRTKKIKCSTTSMTVKLFKTPGSFTSYQDALALDCSIKMLIMTNELDELMDKFFEAAKEFHKSINDKNLWKEAMALPLHLREYTPGSMYLLALESCLEGLEKMEQYHLMREAYRILMSQQAFMLNKQGKWYDLMVQLHTSKLRNIPLAVGALSHGLTKSHLSCTDQALLSVRGINITKNSNRNEANKEDVRLMKCLFTNLALPPSVTVQGTRFQCKNEPKVLFSLKNESLTGPYLPSLEDFVMRRYRKKGYDRVLKAGVSYLKCIFGLFLWDIIYRTKVDNVYICKQQVGPLDLKFGDFYLCRYRLIDQRIKDILYGWNKHKMMKHLNRSWSKVKKMASIVPWQEYNDWRLLRKSFACIGRTAIATLCNRAAKHYSSSEGFPDILMWNSRTREHKFVYAKHNRTAMDPAQLKWCEFLLGAKIPVLRCRVHTELKTHPIRRVNSFSDLNIKNSMESKRDFDRFSKDF